MLGLEERTCCSSAPQCHHVMCKSFASSAGDSTTLACHYMSLCKATDNPKQTCAAPVPSTAVTSADSAGDTRRGPRAPPRAMER